jgi:hypothetical protein
MKHIRDILIHYMHCVAPNTLTIYYAPIAIKHIVINYRSKY